MTAVMICPKCYTVYDVERRPNSEFRVSTPGMTYINFAQTPQIQAAIKPLCVNPACRLLPGRKGRSRQLATRED